MDFYVDIAVAVLLRLLKDKREWPKYRAALKKVRDAIDFAFEAAELDASRSKPPQVGP
jgi:hypothetical protein